MTTVATAPQLETTNLAQNARRSILIMLAGIVGYDLFSWYLAITRQTWQLFVVAGVVLAFGVADVVGLLLARRGRAYLGLWLTVLAFLVTGIVIGSVISGLGSFLWPI